MSTESSSYQGVPAGAAAAGHVHRRLRFEDFRLETSPGGHCTTEVVLSWNDSERFTGRCEGIDSQTGQMRCAAEAALKALVRAVGGRVSIELLGVKAIRSFDVLVVVVSLSSHKGAETMRLVGSSIIEDQPARGAALAVLNATNRLLGNIIDSRGT